MSLSIMAEAAYQNDFIFRNHVFLSLIWKPLQERKFLLPSNPVWKDGGWLWPSLMHTHITTLIEDCSSLYHLRRCSAYKWAKKQSKYHWPFSHQGYITSVFLYANQPSIFGSNASRPTINCHERNMDIEMNSKVNSIFKWNETLGKKSWILLGRPTCCRT